MKAIANVSARLMSFALLVAAGAATAQAQGRLYVEVDDSRVVFTDVQPQMMNGRVMVPIRGVFERLGADVLWTESNQTVTVTGTNLDISLVVDNNTATVNGREVWFDAPARVEQGRTLVPVRFLSETLGANVRWEASERTVHITSASMEPVVPPVGSSPIMALIQEGTVVPFTLDTPLSSNVSKFGDRFTATIDTRGLTNYLGLPAGTKIEGSVDLAQPRSGNEPGILGIVFDNMILPDGRKVPVYAQVIAVDEKNVQNVDGRLVARSTAKKDGHKFVWIGAGGGALLSLVTKTNVITGSVLGAALGYLYDEIQRGKTQANDVTLARGAQFGARMDKQFIVYEK